MSAVVTSQERGESGSVMLTPSRVNCIYVAGVLMLRAGWLKDDDAAIPSYPFC